MTRLTFFLVVITIVFSGVLIASDGRSQNLETTTVHVSGGSQTLNTLLVRIEQQSLFTFSYPEELGSFKLNGLASGRITLAKLLNTLTRNYQLSFKNFGGLLSVKLLPGPGTLSGKVLDEKGEGLPRATIRIIETGSTLQSNVDGTYRLKLAPGSYTVEVSYISYQTRKITGVLITEGKNTPLDMAMFPSSSALNTVTITGDYKRSSVEGLYAKQKNNAAMTDGISAEQIARTPDKNIGESLKRVSGVNMLENKFVVVRGLGERYNNTMLNGQIMPSTELNRKQFSFDLIPSNMVDNITVYKTINPDKSAEFGGGLVEVNTRNIPAENYVNLTVGESYNDQTTGKTFRGLNIGPESYFGSVTSDRKLLGRTNWNSLDEIRADYAAKGNDAALFHNNWKLYKYTPSVSPNFQAAVGRVINLKNNDQIGIMASASYRNTWQTQEINMGRNGYSGRDGQDELYGFTGKRYGFNTNLGGIAGIGYTGKQLKLGLQSIYLRTLDQQLVLGTGDKSDFGQAVGYYDLTTQTVMLQNQFKGEKGLGSKGIKLNWLLSYATLDRQRPDNHQFDARYVGSEKDDPLNPDANFSIITPVSNLLAQGVLRSWNRSFEKNLGWNLDLTVPAKFQLFNTALSSNFKTGYAGWQKDRLFWVANTASSAFGSSDPQPLSRAFQASIHPEGTIDFVRFADQYDKKAALHAGYVMLDSKMGKLRLVAGLRGEYFDLNRVNSLLENFVRIQREQNGDLTDYTEVFGLEQKFNLFPSAGLTYGLSPQMNLRLSYSKSIVRPDLRELSFFQEYDFDLGGTYVSNSPIRSTKIQNLDFRYEWYPGAGEILSVSLFYKKLKNPMEIYDMGNRQFELRNDIAAKNQGIELEARKSFAFTGLPVLRNFTLYGNFTRLFAKVTPKDVSVKYTTDPNHPNKLLVNDVALPEVNRPQAGASNYTYNAAIFYDSKPVTLSLSYNYITNRVFRAASIYKESLFETPLPSMDGQVAVNVLKSKGVVKLNLSNILGKSGKVYAKRQGDGASTLLFEKGDLIDYQANPGRTYGLSFNYNF